jgi:acetylglutamate kinase
MIRVIKIGGRAQGDPTLPQRVGDAVKSGGRLCVVHGGGDEVTAMQRALGQQPRFIDGRRATSPEELEVVRMVLSGSINKRLVAQLLSAGIIAAGISGEDANLLLCSPFGDGSLGAVGEPIQVNVAILHALLDHEFVPVVSPLGRFAATGEGCNVNGDDAAAAIAGALGAEELLLVADVAGVLDGSGHPLPRLYSHELGGMIGDGIATGGMIAKLEAARRALALGVGRVRIAGIPAITDLEAGTVVTAAPFAVHPR